MTFKEEEEGPTDKEVDVKNNKWVFKALKSQLNTDLSGKDQLIMDREKSLRMNVTNPFYLKLFKDK